MTRNPSGSTSRCRRRHLRKAPSPISRSVEGRRTSSRPEQSRKTSSGRTESPSGSVMLRRWTFPQKAYRASFTQLGGSVKFEVSMPAGKQRSVRPPSPKRRPEGAVKNGFCSETRIFRRLRQSSNAATPTCRTAAGRKTERSEKHS